MYHGYGSPPTVRRLVAPSFLSGVFAALLAAGAVAASAWQYARYNGRAYDLFFGPDGVRAAFRALSGGGRPLRGIFLQGPVAYYILTLAAGVIAAVLTYLLLRETQRAAAESELAWREFFARRFPRLRAELLARLAFRAASVVLWAGYAAWWWHAIVPVADAWAYHACAAIALGRSAAGGLELAGAFAAFALSFHVHTVFLRLCALRTRLW